MFVEIKLKDDSTIEVNVDNIISIEKKEFDVYTSVYLADKRVVEIKESPAVFKEYLDKLRVIYNGRMMRAALWEADKTDLAIAFNVGNL